MCTHSHTHIRQFPFSFTLLLFDIFIPQYFLQIFFPSCRHICYHPEKHFFSNVFFFCFASHFVGFSGCCSRYCYYFSCCCCCCNFYFCFSVPFAVRLFRFKYFLAFFVANAISYIYFLTVYIRIAFHFVCCILSMLSTYICNLIASICTSSAEVWLVVFAMSMLCLFYLCIDVAVRWVFFPCYLVTLANISTEFHPWHFAILCLLIP